MGKYENFYLNKIKKLQEENTQLKNLLFEMEQATPAYPPTPLIPQPEMSPPTHPDRGYKPPMPDHPHWLSPYPLPDEVKPIYGPWRIPSGWWQIAPSGPNAPYQRPPYNPVPYR